MLGFFSSVAVNNNPRLYDWYTYSFIVKTWGHITAQCFSAVFSSAINPPFVDIKIENWTFCTFNFHYLVATHFSTLHFTKIEKNRKKERKKKKELSKPWKNGTKGNFVHLKSYSLFSYKCGNMKMHSRPTWHLTSRLKKSPESIST